MTPREELETASKTGSAAYAEDGAYHNCHTQCFNGSAIGNTCGLRCDRQSKEDGSHPGHGHHCPTHGDY